MKVQVFATLKDHFETEFDVDDGLTNVSSLQAYLESLRPAAASLLDRCRYAVQDEFVNKDYQLKENDTIFIIPPSSGG